MRCVPRRRKQLWIFFLLFVCLIGVYLSYKHLSDGRKQWHSQTSLPYNPQLEKTHRQLREKTRAEIERAKAEARLGTKSFKGLPNINKNAMLFDSNAAKIGMRMLENEDDYITPDEMMARLKLLLIDLNPTNWKTAPDVEDMILQLKSELYDLGIDSKMSCKQINALKPGGFRHRSHYGKKSVERMSIDYFNSVMVKSPGKDTQLKIQCMQMDYNEQRCSVMSNYKVMRELVYLLVLDSPSVIKLNGFCLRGETIDARLSKKGVVIITETGDEVNLATVMHFPRQTKLEIAEALLKLLIYMDNSPVGSLGFDKLHTQDFVIFGTDLKLVDLDNIHIGEISCVEHVDCKIPEMSRKEIKCQNNVCKGRNMHNNLLWLNRILLKHLLHPASKKHEMEVEKTLDNIQNLEITVPRLLEKITKWKEDKDPMMNVNMDNLGDRDFGHQRHIDEDQERNRNSNLFFNGVNSDYIRRQNAIKVINDMANKDYQNEEESMKLRKRESKKKVTPEPKRRDDKGGAGFAENLVQTRDRDSNQKGEPEEYIRENHANYPVVMTAIFKDTAKGKPDHYHGATLFSKKKHRDKTLHGNLNLQAENPSSGTVRPSPAAEIQACARKVLNQTDLGRISREKRLMTHLGMKGISETEWRTFAQAVKITRSQGLSAMSHKLVNGGRLKVVYYTNSLGLKKGEFLLEKGPSHHHISFMIAYHLDRTLGLYHIPPVASKVLSRTDVRAVTGDKKFQEFYTKYNESDILHGVLTVPVPPVMKTEKITIGNQETIVTSIHPYSRMEKSQLEYILIWSLMKFLQPSHGFLGYKGHLIHFEADSGFGNMKKYMQGYFYNCQFPNSVFKTLLCYKCSSHKLPKICGLGNEVMKRVKESGFNSQDIQIGKYKEQNLADIIDNNAASVLTVVEHCIKLFSREKVLY